MSKQYYVEKSGPRHYVVRASSGGNSEIVDTFTTKRAAMARVARLNREALRKETLK